MKSKMEWKKILYLDQGVPDNYTDKTFLTSMKKNVKVKKYSLKEVIFQSGIVSQQISIVSIFVAAFIYLDLNVIQPTFIILMSFISVFVYVLSSMLCHTQKFRLEQFITVPAIVFVLSPILKTLTKTISTDTIYAMSTSMLIINLLLYDYGAGVAGVSKALSLNAAIFAAVCLGSRLPSSWHVYAFVMLAIHLFALFPEIKKNLKLLHRKAYILLTEILALVAVLLYIPISQQVSLILTIAHIAVTLVFPLWMIWLQRLKNNIEGPWDEGIVMR